MRLTFGGLAMSQALRCCTAAVPLKSRGGLVQCRSGAGGVAPDVRAGCATGARRLTAGLALGSHGSLRSVLRWPLLCRVPLLGAWCASAA